MRIARSQVSFLLLNATLIAVAMSAVLTAATWSRAMTPAGLPYPRPDRLVTAIASSKSWSPGMLEALKTTKIFDRIAGMQERSATVSVGQQTELLRLESVSAPYFDMLGVTPALGRTIREDEDRRDVPSPVAVISHRLWRRLFDGDDSVVGRRLSVDTQSLVVVGVLPEHFRGVIGRTDIWVPLGSARWLTGDTGPERPTSRWFEVMARVDDSIPMSAATARFAAEFPAAIAAAGLPAELVGPPARLQLTPLSDVLVPPVARRMLPALRLAAAALCLFVIANLLGASLLRAQRRTRDTAVRQALGAGSATLLKAAAREGAAVAAMATPAALLLQPLMLQALRAVRPPATSFGLMTANWMTDSQAGMTPLSIAIIATGTLVPVCISVIAANAALRSASAMSLRTGMTEPRSRWRRAGGTVLLAMQAALACVVVGGALLLGRAITHVMWQDRGYDADGVHTARLALPDSYNSAAREGFLQALEGRLSSASVVQAAAFSNCAPGGGRCRQSNISAVDGNPLARGAAPQIGIHLVAGRYFDAIGATITRGRALTARDTGSTQSVVVVSDTLAERLWPGQDPIGHRLEVFTANGSLAGLRTVVGTVKPIWFNVDTDPALDVYLPGAQASWSSAMVLTRGPASGREHFAAVVREAAVLDSRVVVHDGASLSSRLAQSLVSERLLLNALLAFASVAVLLTGLGTYTMASQVVTGAERELAIRFALGASATHIRALVGRQTLIVALVSAAAGTAGAVLGGRMLTSLLHGVTPDDPVILLAPVLTSLTVMLAVCQPLRRAGRISALLAMRE